MISMGKSGGVYGSGNTGLPQAFSGGKKTQNNQKSIFGAKNKSSVTDIRRMLSRNSQSTQTQAANSWGQDSIVTSSLSYSESLRNQRQQTKNTTLALKKLKYQFKNISSKILRSKTSQAAKQAAGQARREIMRLKRQKLRLPLLKPGSVIFLRQTAVPVQDLHDEPLRLIQIGLPLLAGRNGVALQPLCYGRDSAGKLLIDTIS